MSKFRIKMKLTGFELEVEGTRDEVPQIARNIGQQFVGMLQPAAGIVEGEVVTPAGRVLPAAPLASPATGGENGAGGVKRKSAGRKRRGGVPSASASGAATDLVVEFTHDPAVYGTPKQEWSTANKALWLLYVVGKQAGRNELTAHQIEATFNKYFRQAKQILVQNIARDLGKLRNQPKDAPVAEDNTMEPSPWFLTEAGARRAAQLVAEALGGSARATEGSTDGSDVGGGSQERLEV
jgi:hypothetical protein